GEIAPGGLRPDLEQQLRRCERGSDLRAGPRQQRQFLPFLPLEGGPGGRGLRRALAGETARTGSDFFTSSLTFGAIGALLPVHLCSSKANGCEVWPCLRMSLFLHWR